MQTISEVKNHPEFISGLEIVQYSFNVYLLFHKGDKLKYYAFWKGVLLFEGCDFRPSPLYKHNSLEAICALLDFLTLQMGDIDREHFAEYTPLQKQWCNSDECQSIHLLVSDFEYGKGRFKAVAKKFLQMCFAL